MPLRKNNTRTFHRYLYAGQLETVTLLKRDDDQREGVVKSLLIFDARRSMILKTGQPIAGDETADTAATWHLPREQLDRVGVRYMNVLDRIVDGNNRWWQPESDSIITNKLFENHYCIECVRIDPPGNITVGGI